MATQEVAQKVERGPKASGQLFIRPRGSICGDAEKVILRLEMPGVTKEDLKIDIDGNDLLVVGHRQLEGQGAAFLVRERRQGDFRSAYTLDETIDREKVDAVLKDGVLDLTLHVKEAVRPRKINIKAE